MDAVDEGQLLPVKMLCHCLICSQHEILDQHSRHIPLIKEQLRGRLKAERVEHYRDILPEVAKHSSEMERRADEAERETDKLKKVEYMEQHIGEEYEGVISGVTGWGLYVELPNTVEGLIHISTIPGDYYHYNEAAAAP